MTRRVSQSLRAGAAGLLGQLLLLAAALFSGAPFAAPLAARAIAGKSDSLASIFTCFASGVSLSDVQKGRPGPAGDRGIDCVLCQTLCSGSAPIAARPGLVDASPIQINLPWMVADCEASAPRPRLANRARAPPQA